jgi:hypothetical protein
MKQFGDMYQEGEMSGGQEETLQKVGKLAESSELN